MADEDGQAPGRSVLGWPVRLLLGFVVVLANVGGAAVVLMLAAFVLPRTGVPDPVSVRIFNLGVLGAFLLVAVPLGLLAGRRRFTVGRRSNDPDRRARMIVLHGPARVVQLLALLWAAAVLLFGAVNLQYSERLAFSVAATTATGGITTCALSYLLTERILRRSAARVLSGDPPRRRRVVTGVMLRSVGFWALGTAVPVIGLMLAGLVSLIYGDSSPTQLARDDPGDRCDGPRRRAADHDRGRAGDVRPDRLGAPGAGPCPGRRPRHPGGGLRQHRARPAPGRVQHDGRRAARARAHPGPVRPARRTGRGRGRRRPDEIRLGGERRDAAVLFVDLAGSTSMAARRPPEEVVGLLNRFFGVVVECVEQAGGWINKFEGDAALAVFGAPIDLADPAGAALAAARRLGERLPAEMPEISAGIGVSAGDAVAGNVGDLRRFEYTVIGDPVNKAARLTELAKSAPGGVVASQRAVESAGESEARHWTPGEDVTLRGRDDPTGTAHPIAAEHSGDGAGRAADDAGPEHPGADHAGPGHADTETGRAGAGSDHADARPGRARAESGEADTRSSDAR